MKQVLPAFIAAVLLAFAGWTFASPSPAAQTSIAPAKGADYAISMALFRQPQPGGVVTVAFSIAKGDGAVAYEGTVRGEAAGDDGEAVRQAMRRAADEVADILSAGKVPPRVPSSH